MHMHTTPLRCLRSLPHSLSITDTALQNAKGHIPLVLVLTAKFRKVITSVKKLYLNWEVLAWTSLYLTPEGRRQNRSLVGWEASTTILHTLHRLLGMMVLKAEL